MKISTLLITLGLTFSNVIARSAYANICQPVAEFCTTSDVIETLEEKGPDNTDNAKIGFANVSGQEIGVIVSENEDKGFFAVTISALINLDTINSPDDANADIIGKPISSFRINYNGDINLIKGKKEDVQSYVSLAGKMFAYGKTFIEVPLEELTK